MPAKTVTPEQIVELCKKAGIDPHDLQLTAHESPDEPYLLTDVNAAIKKTKAWIKAGNNAAPGDAEPGSTPAALSAEPAAPTVWARIRDNVPREVLTAFRHDQEFIKNEFRPVDAGHEAEAQAHPDLETITK
jgi:hypothetical protein